WRRLVRPPIEVIFVAPIALVLVVVASTGNPLVAHAVATIAVAGLAIAWLSGALLDVRRTRRAIVLHAIVTLVATVCVTYLAIDRGSLATMVAETWRAVPQP
ncbi:MAG: hypothetical protein NT062_02870, partial [Proteobacteria bacterium]|nr:hypothetical protein [Pseudomonadota bacterium]